MDRTSGFDSEANLRWHYGRKTVKVSFLLYLDLCLSYSESKISIVHL